MNSKEYEKRLDALINKENERPAGKRVEIIKLEPRTKSEQKAYIEGFLRCADCMRNYLYPEGKQILDRLLFSFKNMKGEEE